MRLFSSILYHLPCLPLMLWWFQKFLAAAAKHLVINWKLISFNELGGLQWKKKSRKEKKQKEPLLNRNTIQTAPTTTLRSLLKIVGWSLFPMLFDQWDLGLQSVSYHTLKTIKEYLETILRKGFKWRINPFPLHMIHMMVMFRGWKLMLYCSLINIFLHPSSLSWTDFTWPTSFAKFIPVRSVLLKMWKGEQARQCMQHIQILRTHKQIQ